MESPCATWCHPPVSPCVTHHLIASLAVTPWCHPEPPSIPPCCHPTSPRGVTQCHPTLSSPTPRCLHSAAAAAEAPRRRGRLSDAAPERSAGGNPAQMGRGCGAGCPTATLWGGDVGLWVSTPCPTLTPWGRAVGLWGQDHEVPHTDPMGQGCGAVGQRSVPHSSPRLCGLQGSLDEAAHQLLLHIAALS